MLSVFKFNKHLLMITCLIMAAGIFLSSCGKKEEEQEPVPECPLEDGIYSAVFDTDSTMFHVNEAYNNRGILTVKDGRMTIHVSLQSKKIVNLYPGLADDAAKDDSGLLEPTTDKVTYSDGYEDEVYGFDIPVPALDEEFDLALIGTKGKWYDHKVTVSDPVPGDDIMEVIGANGTDSGDASTVSSLSLSDGEHTAEVKLTGGTGRAAVDSPAVIRVNGDDCIAVITWSSPHYDYMIVDGERYEPVNTDGNSVFEIPVPYFDKPVNVIADTTAMSEPHEIEYTLTFDSASVK